MRPDPATDKVTQYHTGECFKNENLPLYISKAIRASKPFGTLLVDFSAPYARASKSEQETLAVSIKEIIDAAVIHSLSTDNQKVSFDVKAREEDRFYLLMRVADEMDCAKMRDHLYSGLTLKNIENVKLASKSFPPVAAITPESVLSDLEKLLS